MTTASRADRPGSVLIEQAIEPLVVTTTEGGIPEPGTPWVIMIHGPRENRTGNNFWQAQAARFLAAQGLVAARFDLAGHGESLAAKNISVWEEQVGEAVRTAVSWRASAVHVTARGLHAALLPAAAPGLRLAIHPPTPAELAWWPAQGGPSRPEHWETGSGASAEEVAFWAACGAETNLLGGASVPSAVLNELVARLGRPAQGRWDLTLCTPDGRDRHPGPVVAGHQPLARLEAERRGLESVLHAALTRWAGPSEGETQ